MYVIALRLHSKHTQSVAKKSPFVFFYTISIVYYNFLERQAL
jgi:hypothetical protein